MSSPLSTTLPAILLGAALLLTGPVLAQDKRDILDDAAKRQQIEVQRVEAEVQKAKAEARSLAATEPKQAIALLQALRDRIAANSDLPEASRDAMVRSLKNLIEGMNARAEVPAPPVTTPRFPPDKTTEPDAKKQADAAKDEIKRVQVARANDMYLKHAREEGYLAVQLSNERAAIPQVEDITFPKDWVEKSKKRLQSNLTPEERKLLTALNTPMDVELPDSTLEDVIKYLQDKAGVTILVPQTILEEKALTYKVPVSVNLKKVTLRTILKKVLGDVGLVYVVDKATIQATTEERAKTMLTTRTYYIGDLVGFTGQRFGGGNQMQTMTTVNNDDIIGVLIGTVEPNSWWANGGPGTTAFDPRTMSLVVRQTAEVHSMLGLNGGR